MCCDGLRLGRPVQPRETAARGRAQLLRALGQPCIHAKTIQGPNQRAGRRRQGLGTGDGNQKSGSQLGPSLDPAGALVQMTREAVKIRRTTLRFIRWGGPGAVRAQQQAWARRWQDGEPTRLAGGGGLSRPFHQDTGQISATAGPGA